MSHNTLVPQESITYPPLWFMLRKLAWLALLVWTVDYDALPRSDRLHITPIIMSALHGGVLAPACSSIIRAHPLTGHTWEINGMHQSLTSIIPFASPALTSQDVKPPGCLNSTVLMSLEYR